MADEHDAVILLLERLKSEGLEWFRHAETADVDMFERRISGNFSVFETGEIHTIGRKPESSFPANKMLVMRPSAREKEAILGLWLRWNFNTAPFEFRLFVGHWCEIDGKRSFIAFRFEAPETGDKHNYYHCQPCRNFGDKAVVPFAALVSERFPTIPINASNIVELTICALMACMGNKDVKAFVRKLLRDSAADNMPLKAAYARCCH